MKMEPVVDGVFLVKGKNEGRFPYSHSILVLDEDTVLVDTGCGIDILKQLRRKYDIDYVINSHTHPDHSAGNWVFKEAPIHVPDVGFDTSGDIVALSERFTNKTLAVIWQHFASKTLRFKDCRPTHSFNTQTVYRLGRTTFTPIYTPGHTKDHYCFYEKNHKVLLSFDYDFTSFPWYGHRESSLREFEESIRALKALTPKIVVSSHRGIVAENIDSEFDNFLGRTRKREEKILSLLENGRTINQLLKLAPIYGKFPYAEQLLRYWEKQMIKKHLEQLEFKGKVRRCKSHYFKVPAD